MALAATSVLAGNAGKPNVLIIFSDDVGWGDIRCYNNAEGSTVQTPNIDRLARDGMRFTDAHAQSLCAPSRYSMMTGNHPFRTPALGWEISSASSVIPGQRTMAEMFQGLGYDTAFFGKWHIGGQLYGKDGNVIPSTHKINRDSVDWSKPVYRGPIQLGFDYSFMAHGGVQAGPYFFLENDRIVGNPERIMEWSAGRYKNKDNPYFTEIEKDDIGLPDWDSTKIGERLTQKALDFIDRHVASKPDQPFFIHFCTPSIHTPLTPGEFMGKKVAGVTGNKYTDMLYEMDLQTGALIAKLKERGLLNNTIVIFTSDNGPWEETSPESYDSSAHFRGRKGEAYEGGHRIPFIIRWGDGTPEGSKIRPGSVCDKLIAQTDLMPSFAALLGEKLAEGDALDGTDISPYFFGNDSRELREFLFAKGRAPEGTMKDFTVCEYSYRRYGFKIIAANKNKHPGEVIEMYRIETDPSETSNLAGNPEYEGIKNKLLQELKALVNSKRSTPPFKSRE